MYGLEYREAPNIFPLRKITVVRGLLVGNKLEEAELNFIVELVIRTVILITNRDQVFDETVDIYSKVIEDIGLKVGQIEFTDNYVDQIVTPDKVRRRITQDLVDAKS